MMVECIDLSEGDAPDNRKCDRGLSVEPRRTNRKTETRVLFADVMAQEREMERLNYVKSRHVHTATSPSASSPFTKLYEGDTIELTVNRFKQQRAVTRRSKRQKLRRNMTPRSPVGGFNIPPHGGASLVKLDENKVPLQHKRKFSLDEEAFQDVILHSTAWRNLKLSEAPANLLPDQEGVLGPFALLFDAPLEKFDADLEEKCAIIDDFLKPKPLTMASGTCGEVIEELHVEQQIKKLVAEATPLIKKIHAVRANAIITNNRQRIAVYLEQRFLSLEKVYTLVGMPLHISPLEKSAAHRLLRDINFAPEGSCRPNYQIGKAAGGYFGHIYPITVIYLRKLASMPRSTTCMLSRGTHRVEDDPILRFVPHFSPAISKDKMPEFSSTDSCKDTLGEMDNEVNEYVLRYIVRACGGDQTVFEALRRCGSFTQPFASYIHILTRVTRAKLSRKLLHALESQQHTAAIDGLAHSLKRRSVLASTTITGRLQPTPAHLLSNFIEHGGYTGIRNSPSGQFKELAIKYRDLFCRRCCNYSCRNHGRGQPIPVIRVDPSYPKIKAAAKLWRRVNKEQLVEDCIQEDADEEMRTVRAQTAAITKASSKLRTVRLKKLLRSKTLDISDYFDGDGIYQSLIDDRKMKLLSADISCGIQCCRVLSDSTNDREDSRIRIVENSQWNNSEIALLNRLEGCVGSNPCSLAALIATRCCRDVAGYLRNRERKKHSGLDDFNRFQSFALGRQYESRMDVFGNSFEHLRRTRSQRMKDRGANHEYVPCDHEGVSCDSALCSCMRRDHYCEKSCGCSPDCSNRFAGCRCEFGQCRTAECPCYYAARECDPDSCISCGASVLPVLIADGSKNVSQLKACENVNIMRGQMSKIAVSASKTHGWGAYALENVKKGEFIYEYTGSLLSQDEAERRGNVYDQTTVSFLFDLTEDSVVDATRKGNKSKFANHDSNAPKCFARIMLVNGDHRIGIYAKQDISVGDELFFDYGYSGVIPDWSQARIGSSKETESVKNIETYPSSVDHN